MDNKDLITLFFQAVTMMITLGVCFFSFWKFASGKIDRHFETIQNDIKLQKTEFDTKLSRAYQRMDEKGHESDALYLRKEIHEKDMSFVKELTKEQINGLMQRMERELKFINEKLDRLIQIEDNATTASNKPYLG